MGPGPPRADDRSARVIAAVHSRRSPLVAAVGALALYWVTLPPSLMWGGGDFARFQVWASELHLEGGPLGHPLWVLLAHPFTYLPIGDAAYRASLASAVMAAVAVGLFFSLARRLTRSEPAAWLATGALAVSHMFWTYSVVPKVYALNSLLIVAALWFAVRWEREHRARDVCGLALVLGAGLHAHLLFLVLIPAFMLFVVFARGERAGRQLLFAGLTLAGVAATSLLWSSEGGSVTGLAASHLQRFFEAITSVRALAMGLGVLVALILYQFTVSLWVFPAGIRDLRTRNPRVLLLIGLIASADLAFVFSWIGDPPDLFLFFLNWHFFLPLVIVMALVAAGGFATLWPRLDQRARRLAAAAVIVAPVLMYAIAPVVARGALERIGMRTLPGRDNATYILSPWKNSEDGARPYADEALTNLPARSTVLADYGIYWVLHYVRHQEDVRPDVKLIDLSQHRFEEHTRLALREMEVGRHVFIGDTNEYYDMDALEEIFSVVRRGALYELVPPGTSTSAGDRHS